MRSLYPERNRSLAILVISLFTLNLTSSAQLSTFKGEGKVFGRVYTEFYHAFNEGIKPATAFNFRAGILGYEYILNPSISLGFMYDVTRTTNFSYDSTVNILGYFEGSKYTAYLKMCQISWKLTPTTTIMIGQLLSTQYLLSQDRLWEMRFIDVTAQEKFAYGMPADFGMSVIFQPNKQVKVSGSVLNGEGPFRYQDEGTNFLYLIKAEFKPKDAWQLNVYFDYETIDPAEGKADKSTVNLYAGYKANDWNLGLEYVSLSNARFVENSKRELVSAFAAYQLNEKFRLIGRLDYGKLGLTATQNQYYMIGGLQYTQDQNFYVSLNYRQENYVLEEDVPKVYMNIGLHF
jgi:hypothetical protein